MVQRKTGSLASIEQAAAVGVYPGTETQEVDPLIESIEGVDSTPAYKGISYIVIEDLQLADFGNRLPNLSFEVVNGNILENLERDVIEMKQHYVNILVHIYQDLYVLKMVWYMLQLLIMFVMT